MLYLTGQIRSRFNGSDYVESELLPNRSDQVISLMVRMPKFLIDLVNGSNGSDRAGLTQFACLCINR